MWRKAAVPFRKQLLSRRSRFNSRDLVRFFAQKTDNEFSDQENASTREEIVAFFENEGLNRGQINGIFEKFPAINRVSVNPDLTEMVNFLKKQDFDVAEILEKNPLVLDREPKYILQVMEFMTGTGIEGEKLSEFIKDNPEFLTVEYKDLYWVKAFFEDDLGFSDDQIGRILEEVPELTLSSEGQVRSNADLLFQLGLDVSKIVGAAPWILAGEATKMRQTSQLVFDLVGIQQKRVFTLCPELLEYPPSELRDKLIYLHNEGHNVRNLLLNVPGILQGHWDELKNKTVDEVLAEITQENPDQSSEEEE